MNSESVKIQRAQTIEAEAIQLIALIEKVLIVKPPMSAPKANPNCIKELFMLIIVVGASGAIVERLKLCIGPNIQAKIIHITKRIIIDGVAETV
jgi:hypothetical protein